MDRRNDFNHTSVQRAARAMFLDERLELAIAIGSSPKSPLGILVTAPRRDGRALTQLDADLLVTLAHNLAARIERIAIIHNEELRQANKAKDHFLANINHEIRNPLNGIAGIVSMLRDKETDEKSRTLLNTLEACAEQLGSTMDDVLDFTRIESDSVTVVSTNVNLAELVRTTCASYDLEGKQVIIDQIQPEPVFAQCDGGKIRQIVSNYVGNAIKYGMPAGGKVALRVDEAGAGKIKVEIEVTSTGATLAQDEVAVLFTALTRGSRARETKAHGTGLGLALCKKFANAMQGDVGVKSAEGQTTFWFKAEFLKGLPPPMPDVSRSSWYAGLTVLAIEDEPYNRLVLGHYLSKAGISPIWAETGHAAIAVARDQNFDLILMDWLLPDMEGAELLEQIKKTRVSGKLPPVIVLTAYSTTKKRAECLAAGATTFISKPIDLTKLFTAFDTCHVMFAASASAGATDAVVDLSSLAVLGKTPLVIDNFADEILRGQTGLNKIWRTDPSAAALLAHRLKAQMSLIRANACAGLLELLEQALKEKWTTDDTQRLVRKVEDEIRRIAETVRLHGTGSPAVA